MMAPHHYHFDHVWQVPLPLGEAYDVLADVDGYEQWWPQIRATEPLTDDARRLSVRSLIPVTLKIVATKQILDREAGLLRVGLAQDLVGYAQWDLSWQGDTTTAARWTQDVYLTNQHLERMPVTSHRLLRINHTHMMRAGEQGLRRYLALRGDASSAAP